MTEQEHKPLLPDFVKKPSMLLWAAVLPQVPLSLLNGWTLWLVSGEASIENFSLFGVLFAVQAALLILALGSWYFARKQRRCIHWIQFLILFLGQIGFLYFFVTNLWQVIPRNVDRWIVDEGMLSFYAFGLMMPGIFYTGMQLACYELPVSRRKNIGLSLFLTIFAPAAFYLFFLSSRMMRSGGEFFYMFLWPFFFIGLTVIAFIGFIRLMVLFYNWILERGGFSQMLFAILVAIAGPIGGLALNRNIPFPADFQSFAIYIMAVVNGVIVLLPRIKKFETGLLFLRGAAFPFSLYFFLVFLPFLPLTLPAIFALGLGFLFLVPVLLFILHTKKLADDYKECLIQRGIKVSITIMVLGMSILPGYFVWQAYNDKAAVKEAIQYVYSPNYETEQIFKGDLKATQRVLLNLKRFKEGIQLPYISDFYNRVVFEGMVLPDKKIADMYYIFTGKDIEQLADADGWRMGRSLWFGLRRGRMRSTGGGRLPQIDRNVVLESFHVQTMEEGDYKRSKVHLVMQNTGLSSEAEFLTSMSVPHGVVISDFQLRLDKNMAAGQIFERRTAQWVYHMIRDFVRRDPGLLFYKTPAQVELSIYPFTQGEKREAEIVFEFPSNFSPVVQIGDKAVALSNDAVSVKEILSAKDPKNNRFLFVPEEQKKLLPKVKREPYLHFIIDRSQSSLENLTGYVKQIEAVAAQYPQVKGCRITVANFSLEEVLGMFDLHRADTIRTALQKVGLRRQGGFNFERVIKTELLRYDEKLRRSLTDEDWQTYPIFVVITPNKANIGELKNSDFYRDIVPENGNYFLVSSGNDMEKRPLWEKSNVVEPQEVVTLKYGQQVVFLSEGVTSGQVASFSEISQQENTSNQFLVFDSQQNQFVPLGTVKTFSNQGEFIDKISLLWADKQAFLNPSVMEASLPGLVKESKRLSVLIPSTSFIVVEQNVQWKALQLNEKKRLRTANAFEFEEEFKTPAPSFWLLIVISALLLVIKKWWLVLFHGTGDYKRAKG